MKLSFEEVSKEHIETTHGLKVESVRFIENGLNSRVVEMRTKMRSFILRSRIASEARYLIEAEAVSLLKEQTSSVMLPEIIEVGALRYEDDEIAYSLSRKIF